MAISNFDAIFPYIGGFGRYQKILFGVNCYMNVLFSVVYFGQLFMTLTPPHWCHPPSHLQTLNLTQEALKDLTIPKDQVTGNYHSCMMYAVNFTQVLGNISEPDTSWSTTTCVHGWHYNFSLYYPTITSQLNWVCDEDWRPTCIQSLFFAGALFGSPVLGWAADRWGRLPIIILTNLVGGVAGVASAFATSFYVFAVLRFTVGLTFDTHYQVAYMLLLEYVSTEYRTIMANVPIMIFLTASMCGIPWMAVALADWSTFTIIAHSSQFLTLSFIWLVPESARWLLSQGKVDDATKIIIKVARVNNKLLAPTIIREFKAFGTQEATTEQTQASALDLIKTPVLRLRFILLSIMWMVVVLAYDGHIRNTEHIGSNVFYSFTLLGLMELPADAFTILCMEKLGRRYTTSASLVLSGLACWVAALLSETNIIGILIVAMVGRFLVTMSMNVGLQYPVEVIPTVARGSGSGIIHTIGFAAGFLSPTIVYLSKLGHYLPFVILGVISIAGGLVSCLLPETLNEILPDSLHDGETFFTDQGCCYNPCTRTVNEEAEEEKELKNIHKQEMEPLQTEGDPVG